MLNLWKPFTVALAAVATQVIASAGDLNFYSSGSTGIDGPFAPEVVDGVAGSKLQGSVPPGSRVFVALQNSVKVFHILVPLPPSGIFNFTTFTLPANHLLCFDTRGTTNPGVVILATGDMRIGGMISVSPLHTWLASTSDFSGLKDMQVINSPIPGPGGFRGGLSGGFGANQFPLGPTEPAGVTLPLTGGGGHSSYRDISTGDSRTGGGGTLALASSGKVIFEKGAPWQAIGDQFRHFDSTSASSFYWANRPGYYGTAGLYGFGATPGMIVIFANETKGPFADQVNLVAAFEQEFFFGNSMSPPWPVGVRGADMPIDPSARFVEFAGKSLTAVGEPDRVVLEKSGEYKLVLETRNLPSGIIFSCTSRLLRPSDGAEIGRTTLNFPPTFTTAPGVCRAEMMIPITPGGTYITAIATRPIETVFSPIIDGEPLTEMVAQLDLQGGQSIHFKTASGRAVDSKTAYREALKQGKTSFPGFKS